MAGQQMGIDYFSLATDIKDDDKIFELKYRYGMPDGAREYDHAAAWAVYGRFVELLASIYQVGFAAEVTRQYKLRMSQQLGITIAEFEQLIADCVDVGLFDEGMYERFGVLTSRGIQRRYFHAARRRKGKLTSELARFILIEDADIGIAPAAADSSSDGSDVDTMYTSEQQATTHDVDMMYTSDPQATTSDVDMMHTSEQQRIVKDSKGKKTIEDDREASSSSVEEGRVEGALASVTSALCSGRASPDRQHAAPYPLACMGCACEEGARYTSSTGESFSTPWDALIARFREKTGTSEASDFVQRVAAACPAGCDESPERVRECYGLLCEALDKFDRAKAATPTPLALKILEDRGRRTRR